MKLLIDTDGVLADFVGHVITYLRADGHDVREGQFTEYDLVNNMDKACARAFTRLAGNENFCFSVPRLPNAQETLKALISKGHNVLLVTSLWIAPCWEKARTEWFESLLSSKALQKIEFQFVTAEERVNMPGDVLVEDKLKTLVNWSRTNRKSFLINQVWNAGILPTGCIRLPTFTSILEHL